MLVLVHGYSFETVAWSRNAEQSRNQSRSFRKEIRSSYPSLHGALRTIRQTNGQTERHLKAHGTYRRLRLLSVISSGTRTCISRFLENMRRKAGAYLLPVFHSSTKHTFHVCRCNFLSCVTDKQDRNHDQTTKIGHQATQSSCQQLAKIKYFHSSKYKLNKDVKCTRSKQSTTEFRQN